MNVAPAAADRAPQAASEPVLQVRKIGSEELGAALREGWDDFLARRGDLIFLGLLYPIIGLLAAALSLGGNLLPLLFPLVAGITLLGPVAATGFYELARRRESGQEATWRDFLDVRKRPSRNGIMMLTGILVVIFGLWISSAAILYLVVIGSYPETTAEFLALVFTTPQGWLLIALGMLVGLAFAALVLTITVVSMPMLVDRDVNLADAIGTSVRAVMANKGAMVRWGLLVAGLLAIGSVPLFLGLAVVLPLLGYATWHLYTRLVVR